MPQEMFGDHWTGRRSRVMRPSGSLKFGNRKRPPQRGSHQNAGEYALIFSITWIYSIILIFAMNVLFFLFIFSLL